jgi:hypothetical protein
LCSRRLDQRERKEEAGIAQMLVQLLPGDAGFERHRRMAAACDTGSLRPSLIGREMSQGYGLDHSRADDSQVVYNGHLGYQWHNA